MEHYIISQQKEELYCKCHSQLGKEYNKFRLLLNVISLSGGTIRYKMENHLN